MMETRQNSVHFHKPTFLPLLCSRPSIKKVALPTILNQENHQTDPLSPRISCIGQVKRSNKIVGPPTTTSSSITPAAHHRYIKLKRLFSGKNLTFSAPTSTATKSIRGRIKKEEFDNKKINVIDVADMDPPLPVIKKDNDGDGGAGYKESENLWKRRFGGGGGCQLQTLQIQSNCTNLVKVTTV